MVFSSTPSSSSSPSLCLPLSRFEISIRLPSLSLSAGRWLLIRRATFYFYEHRSREKGGRKKKELGASKARESESISSRLFQIERFLHSFTLSRNVPSICALWSIQMLSCEYNERKGTLGWKSGAKKKGQEEERRKTFELSCFAFSLFLRSRRKVKRKGNNDADAEEEEKKRDTALDPFLLFTPAAAATGAPRPCPAEGPRASTPGAPRSLPEQEETDLFFLLRRPWGSGPA